MNSHPIILTLALMVFATSCKPCVHEPYYGAEHELWVLDLEHTLPEKVYAWPSELAVEPFHSSFGVFGYDAERKDLFFATSQMRAYGNYTRLNLQTLASTTTYMDMAMNSSPRLSPGYTTYAYTNGGTVRTKFINGGVDRPIPTHPDIPNANAPRWFQSDRYLIFTSTSGLWMLDLMNSSYRKLYHGYTYSYSLSADGVWLATLEMTFNPLHHTIHLVNTYTGESIVLGDGSNPFFINNDTEILTDEPTGVFVTDLNGNQRKLFTKGNPDAVRVSPNGRHVAHATPDGIAIIDIASGNTIRTIPIRHSDFTPSTLGKWDRMDIRFRSMHFSDDGSKLYFTVQRDFEKDGGC